jgi:hypothetical protein
MVLGAGAHRHLVFPVEEAFEVEGDAGEADLRFGLLDPDGVDEQAAERPTLRCACFPSFAHFQSLS